MPFAAGTCHDCGGEPEEGRTRCARCAKARREREAEVREARRALRLCTICGEKVVPERGFCARHLEFFRARDEARRRAARVPRRKLARDGRA